MTTSASGESLRTRISEAAFRRFLTQSYEGVRIKDIAEECGISNSLLQHYFPKRADLVLDPFHSLVLNALRMLANQLDGITQGDNDQDLVCVNTFYHVFYTILHANHDRLLKLYTVILYDAISLKRGTDLLLDNREELPWQGNTYKSVLGAYAVNGIMAQFVVAYFDNRLSSDLMSFVDMALNMNYDLLELDDARRAFVHEKSAELFNTPATQSFINDYLAYIDRIAKK